MEKLWAVAEKLWAAAEKLWAAAEKLWAAVQKLSEQRLESGFYHGEWRQRQRNTFLFQKYFAFEINPFSFAFQL